MGFTAIKPVKYFDTRSLAEIFSIENSNDSGYWSDYPKFFRLQYFLVFFQRIANVSVETETEILVQTETLAILWKNTRCTANEKTFGMY